MNELEKKRKEVELLRVEAARAEMELQIEEKLAEIDRIKKNILVQEQKIKEIKTVLNKE